MQTCWIDNVLYGDPFCSTAMNLTDEEFALIPFHRVSRIRVIVRNFEGTRDIKSVDFPRTFLSDRLPAVTRVSFVMLLPEGAAIQKRRAMPYVNRFQPYPAAVLHRAKSFVLGSVIG